MVAFPQLSLAAGAIKSWDRRNQFYFQMLQSLAAYYTFELETPFEALPEKIQQIAREKRVEALTIGVTIKERIHITNRSETLVDCELQSLKQRWDTSLDHLLHAC